MRRIWADEEIKFLKTLYIEKGLSISEFYNDFNKKYQDRTKTAVEIKIRKLKLKHTTIQLHNIKSRLNSGVNNGMYGKIGANNGLTKENSERIKMAGEKISVKRKDMFKNGYLPSHIGENNPMYGKKKLE